MTVVAVHEAKTDLSRLLSRAGIPDHAQLAGSFAGAHSDPWDRLLAAQAWLERLTLVTKERKWPTSTS